MFTDEFCADTFREMLVMYDCGKKINFMDLAQQMEGRKYDAEFVCEQLKECLYSSPTSEAKIFVAKQSEPCSHIGSGQATVAF